MKLSEWFQTFTCVKSMLTISLTAAFIFLAITGKIDTDYFKTIFSMVISFYFGSQWEKSKRSEK